MLCQYGSALSRLAAPAALNPLAATDSNDGLPEAEPT
jgi:hypothetical protein